MRAFCLTFARGGYIKSRKKYLGENDMTKTKRNLILVVSLLFAIFTLCSVFAGTSFHTPQTVEAGTLTDVDLQYRRDNPGLYETGTTKFVKDGDNDMNWDYLLSNGPFTFTNGHWRPEEKTGYKLPKGDLVCGEVDELTDLSYGFYNCNNITAIDMTNLNTSNVKSMKSMFYDCDTLKEVDMGDLDTSNVIDMSTMFSQCNELRRVNMSELNTEQVESMERMFQGSTALEEIKFRKPGAGKVTDMSYMFGGCKNLVSLDLSWMDTSSVTNMSGMFSWCSSLTNLNLQNWNTGSVTSMSSMFIGCKSLTSLDVSGFDTSKVTNMSYMFQDCESLRKITFGRQDVNGVTNMNEMFRNCGKLVSLDLSWMDTSSVEQMSSMFRGCSSLTNLNLQNWNTNSVTDMSSMFSGCKSLTLLDVSSFNTSKVESFEGMFAGVHLKELDLSNFVFMDSIDGDARNAMGMLGVNMNAGYWEFVSEGGFYNLGYDVVKQAKEGKTDEIGSELISWYEVYDCEGNAVDAGEAYSSEIEGKSEEEKIIIGMKYAMHVWAWEVEDEEWDFARNMFDTKIEKIILPASAKDAGIWLPSNTTYVAKSGDTEFELEQQILYGYKDLSMTEGTVLVAKTADVENTGVVLDTKTIIIVCAIAGACVLAIIAVVLNKVYKANKRKNRKF